MFGNAPTSSFQAQQAGLDETSYAQAIQQAQQQAQANNGMATATGGQQGLLAQQLFAQANGQGPSLAQGQLQQATDRNISQGAGAIASQRGLNPALQARMILQNQGAQQQQMAGQSGLMRLQEQQGAQNALGQLLGTQRSQDIGQMGANAGMFGTAGGLQSGQNANRITNLNDAQALNQQTQAQNASNKLQKQLGDSQMVAGIAGGVLGGVGGALTKLASGGSIPGQAAVGGDNPANDTVPAMLSPGEVVLPRSVTMAPDADKKAAEFVDAIKKKKGEPEGYGKVVATQAQLHDRLQRLEALCYGGVAR